MFAVSFLCGTEAFAQRNGGGGDIIVFDIVGVTQGRLTAVVCDVEPVVWCLINTGTDYRWGVLELSDKFVESRSGDALEIDGLLWLEDGGPDPIGIHLQIKF